MPPFQTKVDANIPQERHRISGSYFMIGTLVAMGEVAQIAINFTLGFIWGFGWIIAWMICMFITINLILSITVWRLMHDVGMFDSIKRMVILMISTGMEIFPLLNSVPTLSISFILLGVIVSLEDKVHNKRVRVQQEQVKATLNTFYTQPNPYLVPANNNRSDGSATSLQYPSVANDNRQYSGQEDESYEETPHRRATRLSPMADIRYPRYQTAANGNRQYVDQAA